MLERKRRRIPVAHTNISRTCGMLPAVAQYSVQQDGFSPLPLILSNSRHTDDSRLAVSCFGSALLQHQYQMYAVFRVFVCMILGVGTRRWLSATCSTFILGAIDFWAGCHIMSAARSTAEMYYVMCAPPLLLCLSVPRSVPPSLYCCSSRSLFSRSSA